MPYQEQLARKQKELARLLGFDVPPLIPSPLEAAFRCKVAFVFSPQGRNLVMGHFALGSKRVIPIDECPVHHERGNRIAFALRDSLRSAFARSAGFGGSSLLRHLIVRTSQDGREATAMLVVYRNDKSLRAPVKKFLASAEKPDGFFVNIHDKPGPFMVGDETIKIEGRSHVKETVNGVSYLVSPTAFFQTNVGAAAEIVNIVLSEVQGAKTVLDLYCGSGLFSLQLAKAGARVVAIEENRQAIKDAEANLRLNRMPEGQVRFIAGRVEESIRLAAFAKASAPKKPDTTRDWDVVVLDPPRQGCPREVLAAVFEKIRPAKAVYVSCNPEALAGELPVILKAGYRVTRTQAVDMFPHTNHIETVMALTRIG